MDLGLARSLSGDDRLSATGVFVGTAAYSAPEQFRGAADIDPRSDLWSLGAMLYELATGDLPFDARSLGDLVRQVLHESPRRPGSRAPQISPYFESVILCLLAKDPSGRFRSAAELGDVIDRGERSAWWAEADAQATRVSTRPPRRVRIPRETSMWGREKEFAELVAAWDAAKASAGRVVLLEGEAGIGKSRLVEELLARLDAEDVHVVAGGYPPGGAATANGAFTSAFNEQFGAEGLEAALGRHLKETPLLVPGFAALLTGQAPPEGALALTKDSLQTCFVHALRSLAAEKPVVVVIDDLHFAPDEGRSLFASLALAVPGHRVLLVGTARPGLPAPWIAELERAGHCARTAIRRLDEVTVRGQLTAMLGTSLQAEELAVRIAAKAGGNPYFVFEILRSLRESGHLSQAADGAWSVAGRTTAVEIPSSVRDLVAGRLAALAEEDREVLEVAACHGFEFDGRLVAEALGRPRLDVLRRLGRIERETSLVRAAGALFVFDHHAVHEALYDATPQSLREEIHAAIGEALEARGGAALSDTGTADGALCAEIAEHLLRGGRGAAASRYLDAALTHLERGYRNDAVLRIADLALAALGALGAAERVAVLLRKQQRLSFLGRNDENQDVLAEALELADAQSDAALRAQVRIQLGALQRVLRRTEDAGRLLEEADGLAREAGGAATEAAAAGALADFHAAEGRFSTAQRLYERQLALARVRGDRVSEAAALTDLARVALWIHSTAQAREWVEQGLAVARTAGDRLVESHALGILATVLDRQDEPEAAESHRRRTLEIAREIGHRPAEARAASALARGLLGAGPAHRAEAARLMERGLQLEVEMGLRAEEAHSCFNLLRSGAGRYDDARSLAERAFDILAEDGDGPVRTRAAQELRQFLSAHAVGDDVAGDDVAAAWQARVDRAAAAGRGWCEFAAAGVLGRLHHDAGRLAAAHAALSRACALPAAATESETRLVAASLSDLGAVELSLGRLDAARALVDRALAIAWRERDGQGQCQALVLLSRVSAEQGDLVAAQHELDEADLRWRVPDIEKVPLLARQGRFEDARGRLFGPDHERETPSTLLLVLAWRAHLPGGDTAAAVAIAEAALAALGPQVHPAIRMQVRFLLWETTREIALWTGAAASAHLAEAKRILDFMLKHAPPECRESMLANVRLNREIVAACAEQGV